MAEEQSKVILLNLRGTLFQINETLLKKFPQNSMFCKYIEQEKSNILRKKSLDSNWKNTYLNKCPSIFNCILSYFEHNELHFPQNMCISLVEKELEFWGFQDTDLAPCCLDKVLKDHEEIETTKQITKQWNTQEDNIKATLREVPTQNKDCELPASTSRKSAYLFKYNDNAFKTNVDNQSRHSNSLDTIQGKYRCKMANFLSNPTSSLAAKTWSVLMMMVIVIPMLILMLETETSLRYISLDAYMLTTNITIGEGLYKDFIYKTFSYPGSEIAKATDTTMILFFTDVSCTLILTFDFILRLILSPRKLFFLRQFMSVVDLLGLVPVWALFVIVIFVYGLNLEVPQTSRLYHCMLYLAFFRLIRLLRFGHIMHQYKTLKTISLALKRSFKELAILILLLGICSYCFGILIFYIELETQDTFLTIFHAVWWAIVTMTTVGYGDMYPKSGGGYFIGVLCAISGIIVVAMTTTILVNSFLVTYENIEKIERVNKRFSKKKNYGRQAIKIAPTILY